MEVGNSSLNFLKKVIDLINKFGFFKIIQSIIAIALLLFVVLYIPLATQNAAKTGSLEGIVNMDREKEREHQDRISQRVDIQSDIMNDITYEMSALNADRIFVMELHNGNSSLNGLSFVHGSITYEQTRKNVDYISDEFQNISLSHYNFPLYLHKKHILITSIDDLLNLDKKLAIKLMAFDVKYVAIIVLYGDSGEYGYIGITYNRLTNLPTEEEIRGGLVEVSQKVGRVFYK